MISIKPRKQPPKDGGKDDDKKKDNSQVTSGATGGDDVAMEVTVDNSKDQEAADKKAKEAEATEEDEIKSSVPILDGLSSKMRSELLCACVSLIGVPVDPDALNAVLRVSLRLTQVRKQMFFFTFSHFNFYLFFRTLTTP